MIQLVGADVGVIQWSPFLKYIHPLLEISKHILIYDDKFLIRLIMI